ncbi:liquid facets [Carabus blaptoides fortunei]
MSKRRDDMQVNLAGIRRNVKNIAHNYSDAQKKVREATSNDPWGPSSTLMAEIADLTYNVVAFTEIMQMVWKRLNDHGRNWRHVYKALVLLEYLIKTGTEKVGQQCKENIFAIQTLKDFQHLEEGKDQGLNVREKAKQLVVLLKDDERLRNERARALKAKERFAQSASGFGSDGGLDTPTSPKYPAFHGWSTGDSGGSGSGSREADIANRELESARPQTVGEEELQLQLALAMSREEAEQEEQKRRSDDVRLQLALSQSEQDFKKNTGDTKPSHVLDLLDVNLGETSPAHQADPWGLPQAPPPQMPVNPDPWRPTGASPLPPADPWMPVTLPKAPTQQDPWQAHSPVMGAGAMAAPVTPVHQDLWSSNSQSPSTDLDEFDAITNRNRQSPKSNGTHVINNNGTDPFELSLLGDTLAPTAPRLSTGTTKKTPQSFLGENSSLVNLDNLVTASKQTPTQPGLVPAPFGTVNPFSDAQPPPRPVFQTTPPRPTINQMKQQTFGAPVVPIAPTVHDPWTPVVNSSSAAAASANATPWMKPLDQQPNPFLS